MKKILAMLTVTMTMSIVLFGFVNRQQNAALNKVEPGRMVRFIIDCPEQTPENLHAQIRVISTITGKTAYDQQYQLKRENDKYVTAPLMLDKGSYRVEAITYSSGTATVFSSTQNIIINGRK